VGIQSGCSPVFKEISMVKECQVITNNDAITVVRYGDTDIQFPAIGRKTATVKVLFKDGKYRIVPDDFKEYLPKPKKQNRKKYEETEE
jgi:hypothetical protein